MRALVVIAGLSVGACAYQADLVAVDGGRDVVADAGARDGGAGPGGDGVPGGAGGGTTHIDAGPCLPQLRARLRDFKDDHPDFEHFAHEAPTPGLVRAQLGADDRPVYAPAGPTEVTSGQASFDQWYRDVPGVNMTFERMLPLTQEGMHWVYDSSAFFPLDGQGFGNQGRAHNFHFTTEIHASFVYEGHESFTFRGDDDVFVFVNKRLALDLGGVHSKLSGTIDFDAQAGALGLTPGHTYALDIFHAERHTEQSNFRVETTIACLIPGIG